LRSDSNDSITNDEEQINEIENTVDGNKIINNFINSSLENEFNLPSKLFNDILSKNSFVDKNIKSKDNSVVALDTSDKTSEDNNTTDSKGENLLESKSKKRPRYSQRCINKLNKEDTDKLISQKDSLLLKGFSKRAQKLEEIDKLKLEISNLISHRKAMESNDEERAAIARLEAALTKKFTNKNEGKHGESGTKPEIAQLKIQKVVKKTEHAALPTTNGTTVKKGSTKPTDTNRWDKHSIQSLIGSNPHTSREQETANQVAEPRNIYSTPKSHEPTQPMHAIKSTEQPVNSFALPFNNAQLNPFMLALAAQLQQAVTQGANMFTAFNPGGGGVSAGHQAGGLQSVSGNFSNSFNNLSGNSVNVWGPGLNQAFGEPEIKKSDVQPMDQGGISKNDHPIIESNVSVINTNNSQLNNTNTNIHTTLNKNKNIQQPHGSHATNNISQAQNNNNNIFTPPITGGPASSGSTFSQILGGNTGSTSGVATGLTMGGNNGFKYGRIFEIDFGRERTSRCNRTKVQSSTYV
jgi:hypothetical protein